MDRAFLELLEKKDMEYITVKEICEAAGVNRSTFYLHYETIDDLLAESLAAVGEIFFEDVGHGCPFYVRCKMGNACVIAFARFVPIEVVERFGVDDDAVKIKKSDSFKRMFHICDLFTEKNFCKDTWNRIDKIKIPIFVRVHMCNVYLEIRLFN